MAIHDHMVYNIIIMDKLNELNEQVECNEDTQSIECKIEVLKELRTNFKKLEID